MPWDPELYHQFQSERSAPFFDLLSLVAIQPGLNVIDLGCGTGELTYQLAEHLPGSTTLGIDASQEMLARALPLTSSKLHFELARIEEIQGQWDLVFSNAAIQWVDNHPWLVPRLLSLARPGGQLAVQLPSNHHHPAHRLILEIAQEEPFYTTLGGWVRQPPVLSIENYAELLFDQRATEIIVFEKIYPHVLADADAIADWTSGTALVPYFERLGAQLREPFLERYRQRLRQLWPSGPVFYPFRRILFSARRSV